jgi:Mg2+ and Co2+ transporter CorA
MMPLTLVSGIYGMNIALPFASHPWAFALVVSVMILVTATMLVYFRKNKLL